MTCAFGNSTFREQQGELRALRDRPAGMRFEAGRQRVPVDNRVAPVVEANPLGKQLGTDAVAVAGDRVDAK